MKIVALLPVKNETWILPTTLPQLKRFVDHIIMLDGQSTDRTREIAQEHGAQILLQDNRTVNFASWRQTLLEAGRQAGGTHFVWLDADEAFTTNFLASFRNRLASMKPGQKLVLDWLCLWKDPTQVRADSSIWNINPKDFVFCDDHLSQYPLDQQLHESRTPSSTVKEPFIRIPREEGAVLHFQFVPFKRFLMKQAYMRCQERSMRTAEPRQINMKYFIARDKDHVLCRLVPAAWLAGLNHLERLKVENADWHYSEIQKYFVADGIEFYEPLDIWHIPELENLFVTQTGREPVVEFPSRTWQLQQMLKDLCRNWVRQYRLPGHLYR
jgi:glycosyltransferase involved in cell wall biosynthesis